MSHRGYQRSSQRNPQIQDTTPEQQPSTSQDLPLSTLPGTFGEEQPHSPEILGEEPSTSGRTFKAPSTTSSESPSEQEEEDQQLFSSPIQHQSPEPQYQELQQQLPLPPHSSISPTPDMATHGEDTPMVDPVQHQQQMEQVFSRLDLLQRELENTNTRAQAVSQQVATKITSIKVRKPDPFSGSRSKLSQFLSQLNTYFRFHSKQFTTDLEKVLFASTYLTQAAFDWFEPVQREYEEAEREGRPVDLPILTSYNVFIKKLEDTFGVLDKEQQAERNISALKQTTSASAYATEFQQHASHLKWNDAALCKAFYEGLKDRVQDELARDERPKELTEMISKSVRIDNRLFEREREKKATNRGSKHTNYSKYNKPKPRDPYGPMPMDLSATQPSQIHIKNLSYSQQPSRTIGQPLSKEEKDRRVREGKCKYCNKPGHTVFECRTLKRNHPNTAPQARQTAATNKGKKKAQQVSATILTPEPSEGDTLVSPPTNTPESSQWDLTEPPIQHSDGEPESPLFPSSPESISVVPETSGDTTKQETSQVIDWDSLDQPADDEDTSHHKHPDHKGIHWSFCPHDDCWTHRGGKEGSNFWPSFKHVYKGSKKRAKK